ncbi:MAG: glucose-1-phosphate adenylyltransferase, partial [Treponemataceae bacterium]|nr:glucose-1-phosphate adenylyltransferase [Treponemataceae bacterium]
IYTHMRNLPPAKINSATVSASLISEGCVITECTLRNSVIGVRSIIGSGTQLAGVIMMGADFYENAEAASGNKQNGIPQLGIGRNCRIARTIIDKNAHIGSGVRINVDGNAYENGDHGSFYCADGIIVIRKGAVIADGTVI